MSVWYKPSRQRCFSAGWNLTSDDLRLILVTSAYVAAVTDEFLSSVPAGARLNTPVALASKTITDGVFNAATVTITGVADLSVVHGLVLEKHTGTDSTSPLFHYMDEGYELDLIANGNDIEVRWDASGIVILEPAT